MCTLWSTCPKCVHCAYQSQVCTLGLPASDGYTASTYPRCVNCVYLSQRCSLRLTVPAVYKVSDCPRCCTLCLPVLGVAYCVYLSQVLYTVYSSVYLSQVLYTVSTEVILACPMKFSAYPLDKQTCKFLVSPRSTLLIKCRQFHTPVFMLCVITLQFIKIIANKVV